MPPLSSDDSQDPVDAGSPNRRRRRADAPDVENALTQIDATLQGLQQQQRELAQNNNQPQVPQPDVPEDPDYDWNRLRLPMATSFPVPCNGRVQRMASELLARLACRDQKEVTFVFNMAADWPGFDDEGRPVVY